MENIPQVLRNIADQLERNPNLVGGLVGPGVVVLKGMALNVKEPISTEWTPPEWLRSFMEQGRMGHEPSNAPRNPDGSWRDVTRWPARSPNGFPLFYPGMSSDGMQGDPDGWPPMINDGGRNFRSEEERKLYWESLKELEANNAAALEMWRNRK